jgi:hypothetical protein
MTSRTTIRASTTTTSEARADAVAEATGAAEREVVSDITRRRVPTLRAASTRKFVGILPTIPIRFAEPPFTEHCSARPSFSRVVRK